MLYFYTFADFFGFCAIMNFLKEIIMIKAYGKNFVQFKKSAFAELITELTKVEGYMIGRCDTLNGCDYWGIVDAYCDENSFVNLEIGLEGNPHGVTWFDIKTEFPRLIQLLDAFNLHYYIGKNYVGNWGVHRHIYDESSTMNLCLLVKGNNWGTVNFHEFDNNSEFNDMSDDHIFDLHDQEFSKDTIIESVDVKDGQCYSFFTGQWHSHIVQGKKAELFLLHFRDARDTYEIVDMFD